MNSAQEEQHLLQVIFERFHRNGEWPLVDDLRAELDEVDDDLDVPVVGRRLDSNLGALPQGYPGPATLTIHGVAACVGSEEELADLLLATQHAYRLYRAGKGKAQVTNHGLRDDLDMDDLRITRVEKLMHGLPWDGGGGVMEDGSWYRIVSPDIVRFKRIQTVGELLSMLPGGQRVQPGSADAPTADSTTSRTAPAIGALAGQGYRYEVALSFAGERRAYVEQVAEGLRTHGVSVFYDAYEKASLWGKNLYDHLADVYGNQTRYVVMFASREYADKAWPDHERQSAQARALKERREYILPARFDDTEIPGLLSTVSYIDLRKTSPNELTQLILEKLGAVPSTAIAQPDPPLSPTAIDAPIPSAWCLQQRTAALRGLAELGKTDFYEARSSITPPLSRSQKELLGAAERANIDTFGWPIAIVLPSGPDAPHPTAEGLVATVVWKERGSFDHWALRRTGEFYLLKTLSEDVMDKPGELLFNTRVVRVAETVMFLARLYEGLGAAEPSEVELTIRHVGLDHRPLGAANNRRLSIRRVSKESEIESSVRFTLADATGDLLPIVKAILDPVFIVYEFFELSDQIYRDLIDNFRAGSVT